MDSALTTVGLPLALAIIMFGLGLDLTIGDFKRVGRAPRAVAVALGCQVLLLPAICFGLVVLFDLPALLGIGMLLLAASPGGTTANLFSHLFRGDVALNITLTAINTVIAVVTLPVITGQDAEVGSVQSIIAGEQYSTIFKDTRLLAEQAVTMVDSILHGDEPEVNDTETYDNGELVVPSYLLESTIVTVDNYEEVLIDSEYYSEDDLS